MISSHTLRHGRMPGSGSGRAAGLALHRLWLKKSRRQPKGSTVKVSVSNDSSQSQDTESDDLVTKLQRDFKNADPVWKQCIDDCVKFGAGKSILTDIIVGKGGMDHSIPLMLYFAACAVGDSQDTLKTFVTLRNSFNDDVLFRGDLKRRRGELDSALEKYLIQLVPTNSARSLSDTEISENHIQ